MAALDAHIVGLMIKRIDTCIFMKVVVMIDSGISHACLAAPLWDTTKVSTSKMFPTREVTLTA